MQPIRLPRAGPSVLAVGGHLKNTVCLTRGAEAFLSPSHGDLDTAAARRMLAGTVAQMLAQPGSAPQIVAHDLHPDYYSTRFAADLARQLGVPLLAVQHHHAHIAAVAAEHSIDEPLLGLALDGVGLGAEGDIDEPPRSPGALPPRGADTALGRPGGGIDEPPRSPGALPPWEAQAPLRRRGGGLWGGELLHVDGAKFSRLGHLRELPLPGGDRAAREPWRMALAALHLLGRDADIAARYPERSALVVRRMIAQGVNCPPTSSCGRWFDAAAALLRIKQVAAFEGEAAMQLEAMAVAYGPVPPWADGYVIAADGTLDLLPLLARLADQGNETDAGFGSALFHATLAHALAQWVLGAVAASGIRRVALGGGCFLNRVMSDALRRELEAADVTVLQVKNISPGDAGIALGQAWVAMMKLTKGS